MLLSVPEVDNCLFYLLLLFFVPGVEFSLVDLSYALLHEMGLGKTI